jgi:hypothetical protein
MTTGLRSEYVGFTVDETSRVYTMRVRILDGTVHDVHIAIATRAFLTNRVRYQDAAEICFLKLRRALSEYVEGTMPPTRLEVTDAELEAYREAHTKKPPKPRPRFPSNS